MGVPAHVVLAIRTASAAGFGGNGTVERGDGGLVATAAVVAENVLRLALPVAALTRVSVVAATEYETIAHPAGVAAEAVSQLARVEIAMLFHVDARFRRPGFEPFAVVDIARSIPPQFQRIGSSKYVVIQHNVASSAVAVLLGLAGQPQVLLVIPVIGKLQ